VQRKERKSKKIVNLKQNLVLHWSGNGFGCFNLGEVNCTEERKIKKLVILIQILVNILS
jgi:hypothetical protein